MIVVIFCKFIIIIYSFRGVRDGTDGIFRYEISMHLQISTYMIGLVIIPKQFVNLP